MCLSLTDQVRSIATVTTAVARGDLSQKVTIQAEGEISTLKDTVNSMVDQVCGFLLLFRPFPIRLPSSHPPSFFAMTITLPFPPFLDTNTELTPLPSSALSPPR
jgi:hypothetical protein